MTTIEPISATAPGTNLLITVMICTRNRAAQLRNVLESAARMHIPQELAWELVVVDNGSSDDTADVVRSFASRLPTRLVREDKAGLSNARNRGVAEARGRYICWTDDDVIIDEGWLAAYAAAIAGHPDAVVFGGRITPVLEPPTPAWFARMAPFEPLSGTLAQRDFGDRPLPLDPGRGLVPWGANYAVRTAEQRNTPYDPGLGVSPYQKRIGEEVEVINQLLQGGGEGWWVPDARVLHMIPPHRQTAAYLFRYFTSKGETVRYQESARLARQDQPTQARAARWTRRPAWYWYAQVGLHGALFGLMWLAGARQPAVRFLVRAGFRNGVARHAAADQRQRLPSLRKSAETRL